MKNTFTKLTFTKLSMITFGVVACGLSAPAFAQDSGVYELANRSQISTSIGINFTMPFGQKRTGHREDKTRIGFNMGLVREYETRAFAIPNRTNVNLLEMGFAMDGTPNLLLSGQDIYTPLFGTLSANDEEEPGDTPKTKGSGGSIALGAVLGAAAIVGLAAIAAGDLNDSVRDGLNVN